MITSLLRRDLSRLCFNNSSSLCQSLVAFSFFRPQFSTLGQRQPVLHPTISELLLQKHHFSPEAASKVACALTRLRKPEKSDSVLSYLKESGFSKTQVENIVKCRPELLSANLEKMIKPKINLLRELGLSAKDVAKIISNDPWILQPGFKTRFIPSLSVLKRLLGSDAEVAKYLKTSGWFLKTNLDNNLIPNVEFLKNCGIPMKQIIWIMYHFPRLLLRRPEVIKKYVHKADEMGVSRSSKMFIHAVRVLGSMSDDTLTRKLRTVRKFGFSEGQIAATFKYAPVVFGVSEKKIKEVKEVLLASGKYEFSCILNNPISVLYSVKKRYKPRLQVLKILENKNIIERWPCFSTLMRLSHTRFYEKFVGPYLDEVGDVYKIESSLSEKSAVKQILSI